MLTVALPIYRMKQIAWLAFEGLARQEKTPKYELLVCEEKHEYKCGNDLISKYKDRLLANGCVNIQYIELDKHVNLAKKWQIMGQCADNSSIGFVLTSADCFSHSLRLHQTNSELLNGAEWYHETKGFFFDLVIKRLIQYRHETLNSIGWKTGLNMAFATKYARNIPDTDKTSGIDNFLFQHCLSKGMKNVVEVKPAGHGVDTNSANNISHFRIRNFLNANPPFVKSDATIFDIGLPKDIAQKLYDYKLTYQIKSAPMSLYKFIKNRNVYKIGDVEPLSEAVALLFLKEEVVVPFEVDRKIEKTEYSDKQEKTVIENKEADNVPSKRKGRKPSR